MIPWLLLTGCTAPTGTPTWIGWRGADGFWPPNSATAVARSLDEGIDLHLEVGVTSDGVGVLAGATLGCRDDEGALAQPLVVADTPWEDLEARVCGDIADPVRPNALLVPEAPLSIPGLVVLLKRETAVELTLDLAYDPEGAAKPEVWGPAVLDPIFDADRPQTLAVLADHPAILDAVRAHAAEKGRDLTTWLRWPPEPSLVDLGGPSGLDEITDSRDWDDIATAAGVDGLVVHWGDAWPGRLARTDALIRVGPESDPDVLDVLSSWPADAVLTPYPR